MFAPENSDDMEVLAGMYHSRHLSISSFLRERAERAPDAAALVAPGYRPLTYGRLASQIEHHARDLSDLGVDHGDRVAIVLPQGPEMITAFLAVAVSATAAPLNPGLDGDTFAFWFSRLRPRAIILLLDKESPARAAAERAGVPVIELSEVPGGPAGEFILCGDDQHPHPASGRLGEPDDIALMLATSGTTSRPQLVPLTHRNICAAAENTSAALELTANDTCLDFMPLFHGHGLIAGALATMIAGGCVVCTRGFDAASFFRWLDEFHPTWYTAVPTIHRAILAQASRHHTAVAESRLRFIRSGSAHLPRALMVDLERVFGAPVTESYGLTEALQLTNTPLDPQKQKVGSVGVTGTSDIAIMDEAHSILEPHQPGEIVCRGPVLMSGYFEDADANARSFVDGWFRTGDLGYIDADGHLFMTGRLKDIINRGGEKVLPEEVDDVLLQCPQVVEAATFAVSHPTLGEDVAAAVVLRGSIADGESVIREFAARRLPPFRVPRRILIVKEIPKGPTGKVQRAGLAEKLGLADPGRGIRPNSDFVAPRSPLEHQLAAIWEEVFGLSPIGRADDFFDLGGDSLMAAALMAAIEEGCSRALPPAVLLEAPTVARLADVILREDDGFDEPLTTLRASGTRTSLFFVHNDYRRGLYTYNLARCLHPDRPVYTIHLHGLVTHSLPDTVEAIAADRLRAVRQVRPHGPYALGGHCFGGLVALEMAHQLRAAGERVEVVALIDAPAPRRGRRAFHGTIDALARACRFPPAARAGLHVGIARPLEQAVSLTRYYWNRLEALARSGALAQAEFVGRKLAVAAGQVRAAFGHAAAPGETPGHPALAAFADPHQRYRMAIRRYVPGPYAGPVVLFRAEELPTKRPDLGWPRRLLPHLTVVTIPGDHHTCVTRHVATFAGRLEEMLQKAGSGEVVWSGG